MLRPPCHRVHGQREPADRSAPASVLVAGLTVPDFYSARLLLRALEAEAVEEGGARRQAAGDHEVGGVVGEVDRLRDEVDLQRARGFVCNGEDTCVSCQRIGGICAGEDGCYQRARPSPSVMGLFFSAWQAVLARGRRGGPEPRVVVPPRRNAVLSTDSDQAPTQRDEHIVAIRELGRPRWKRESGYYKQSHAEGAFSRHKRVFGGHLRARHDEARQREAELTCVLLNRMGELGRPESYPVA